MKYFDKFGVEIPDESFLKFDYGEMSNYACIKDEAPKQVKYWHDRLFFVGDSADKPLYPEDTKNWILA